MGLFDKVKKILFDEDEVEVQVGEDELPEREPKKEKISKSVLDDHNGDLIEKKLEDTIVEIKLPTEDEEEEEELPKKTFKFDVDIDADLPVRSRTNESLDELPTHEAFEKEILHERDRRIEEEMVKRSKPVISKTPAEEVKDYKKLLEDKPVNSTMKKPFRVTPVISPVFGYVDPDYVPSEEPKEPVKKEPVQKTVLPRDFGPVSYNDAPIPVKTKVIKEEITELNTGIDEMVREEPISVVKKTTVVETEILMPEKKEEIPDVETSGIEDDYLNNGIEDAFETTSEFDKIKQEDEVIETEVDDTEEFIPGYEDESIFEDTKELEPSYVSEYDEDFEATAPINLDELDNVTKSIKSSIEEKNDTSYQIEEEIEEETEEEPIKEETTKKKKSEVEDDDENLDETIETDLFNLIDSMYKSDDDEEEEEE